MPGTVVGVASERDVLILESDARAERSAFRPRRASRGGKAAPYRRAAARTLVISRENLHGEHKAREALAAQFGDRAVVTDGLGAVSVIGAGINASYANVRAGISALREAGIEPRGMSTSSFRITWMVPDSDVERAVRALHAHFITAPGPLLP